MESPYNFDALRDDIISVYKDRLEFGDNHRAAFMCAISFVHANRQEADFNDVYEYVKSVIGDNIDEFDGYRYSR